MIVRAGFAKVQAPVLPKVEATIANGMCRKGHFISRSRKRLAGSGKGSGWWAIGCVVVDPSTQCAERAVRLLDMIAGRSSQDHTPWHAVMYG